MHRNMVFGLLVFVIAYLSFASRKRFSSTVSDRNRKRAHTHTHATAHAHAFFLHCNSFDIVLLFVFA